MSERPRYLDTPRGPGNGRTHRRRRLVVVAVMVAAATLVLAGSGLALAFTDTVGNPYVTAIDELAGRHIINGFPGDVFKPNDLVTRQQFAKMAVLTMGYQVTPADVATYIDTPAPYDPIKDPLYPGSYVAVASSNGIIRGYPDNTFRFGNNITRQQAITMVARAANIPEAPPGYDPGFSVGQFVTADHFNNARNAAKAGLLEGLVGVGPSFNFGGPTSRGECAQLLWNLLNTLASDTSLPAFADLKPAGPVGFTFTLDIPPIWAAEHEDDGIWPKTLDPATVTGHLSVQTVAVGSGKATIKLVLDSITVTRNDITEPGDDLNGNLPAFIQLQVDDQGKVLAISYRTKNKPEQELDQQTVAGLSTFITPVTAALMVPYSAKLAKPNDSVHTQVAYTSLSKKLMDVDTKIDYLSFNSGVATLGFALGVTNIDVPLTFDFRLLLPLLGEDVPSGGTPWIMEVNVGTTISATGEYDLDTTSGMPVGMTLSSTMKLDAYFHKIPSTQLLKIWPNSDFAHGWVDHAYLRGLDHASPITITFSMTKDAAD